MRKKDALNEAIESIGCGLKDEYKIHPERPEPQIPKAGPNTWQLVTAEDYGTQHDYETYDLGNYIVYFPVCRAAREWGNKHLPDWLTRWSVNKESQYFGWKIPAKAWPAVQKSLERDKLISEDEYREAMNEMDSLARQWE